ncbi:MAG: (d)CMP kinase [Gemmatimonadota bacterium]|nr:(d)CMP kinase [Gemmatimonadota bacterium]
MPAEPVHASPDIIAIDGPAASGKSSTATAVAAALGYAHLDSGALYRGVTLIAIRECGARPGVPLDAAAILRAAAAKRLELRFDGAGFAVMVEGVPVETAIRGAEVTALVSPVSALPPIRAWVTERLRALGKGARPLVVDGRDIGTVVFPGARLKIFLNASPRTRASRRLAQRGEGVTASGVESEAALLAARDAADASRPVAPLRMAEDAVPLDGTDLSFAQQVAEIVRLARGQAAGGS